MNDGELHQLLISASGKVPYPATPDLATRVLTVVSAGQADRRERRRESLVAAPVMVLAVAVVTLALIAVLVSPAGEAVARFFGVEGSKVERLPPGEAGAGTPPPTGLGAGARTVSIAEAAVALGFQPATPHGHDQPAGVFLIQYGEQAIVVLRYEDFDIWQARLRQRASFGKQVPAEGAFREVSVRDQPAHWLSGGPHYVSYTAPDGKEIPESARTVEANTLVWRTESAFYRIETVLGLDAALRIAERLP